MPDRNAYPLCSSTDSLSHLVNMKPSGKFFILPDSQISAIKTILNGANDGRYSAMRELPALGLKTDYDIIKIAEKYYALYYNEKVKVFCGIGTLGVVKYAHYR